MTNLSFLDPHPDGEPAILLLHGLGATGASWSLQFPALERAGYRPIAPDAPGFGASPYDGQGWSLVRTAASLADLVRELGLKRVHIAGLSLGGVIAQQFAIDHPDLVETLSLVSTFAALRPDTLRGWIYFLRRAAAVTFFGLHAQAVVVAKHVFPHRDQSALRDLLIETISSADVRAYRAAMLALGRFDSRPRLGRLAMPVLVVTGAQDTTVIPARQAALAQAIPGARQVIIPGAGHAVPIDQAEAFNHTLLEFLQAS